jgi:hypothetical protein
MTQLLLTLHILLVSRISSQAQTEQMHSHCFIFRDNWSRRIRLANRPQESDNLNFSLLQDHHITSEQITRTIEPSPVTETSHASNVGLGPQHPYYTYPLISVHRNTEQLARRSCLLAPRRRDHSHAMASHADASVPT